MHAWFVLPLLALAACVTTTVESAPPGAEGLEVTKAYPARAWFVVEAGHAVGSVVRYETFESSERFLYSVRNVHDQDLGIVDQLGRAYRYRPHREEPEWVGSGDVLAGVRRILELVADATLREVDVEHLLPGAAAVPLD